MQVTSQTIVTTAMKQLNTKSPGNNISMIIHMMIQL